MIRYTLRDRLVPLVVPARRARSPARSPLSDPVDGRGVAAEVVPVDSVTVTAAAFSRRERAGYSEPNEMLANSPSSSRSRRRIS